jgi:hypothetical protein
VYPSRADALHTFVWLLCPSTPHACSMRRTKWSSPGRPTWYMTSSLRFSTIARRMRPPMSSSAASQLTSTNSPEPRLPVRFRGLRIRSVSLT